MSKHWDPSWARGTIVLRGVAPPVQELEAAIERGKAMGLPDLADADLSPCEAEDGLARMATVGPEYDVLVRASKRVKAAELQRQIGRLTFYFICTRPRVEAVDGACSISNGNMKLAFSLLDDNGEAHRSSGEVSAWPGVEELRVERGGRSLVFTKDSGEEFEQDAGLVAQKVMVVPGARPSPFDLQVHYIGRGRGTTEQACALDRLEQHPKYQQVLEQVIEWSPNRDVWMLLSGGTTIDILSGGPGSKYSRAQLERADDHAREVLDEKSRIDLVEALMINYFKPELNSLHVEQLDLKTKVMKKCFEAGLTGLVLSFCTNDLGVSVYSERVEPDPFHCMKVCL
jgi:hypothetical protein